MASFPDGLCGALVLPRQLPPALVQQLQDAGHQACISGVMPGQLRTDAELPELLQICCNAKGEGT